MLTILALRERELDNIGTFADVCAVVARCMHHPSVAA
jgi:hypothetical protein